MIIRPYDCDDELIEAVRVDGRARMRVSAQQAVAVVLGRGSEPEVELYVDKVRTDGVPVLRRRGGGCAVVLDPGNVLVSVVLPLPGILGIKPAFRRISDWLIAGLSTFGVRGVRQGGVSDLVLGDRKVGGSAVYRAKGLLYYSGTLLVSPDLERIGHYLRHPPREPDYRRVRPHRDFMGRVGPRLPSLDARDCAERLEAALSLQDLTT